MCHKGFCLILNIGLLMLLGSNTEARTTTDILKFKREECCKVAFSLSCDDALKKVGNITHVWWKVWDRELKMPVYTAYCGMQDTQLRMMNCIIINSTISGKVKILGISESATLTVEHGACELDWIYECEVENHTQTEIHQIEVDTSVECKWYDLGTDVDLTSDLLKRDEITKLLLYKNLTRFIGYCNDTRCVPVGWKRLQARNKSLWLLDIREDDNGTLLNYEVDKKENSHEPKIFKRRLLVNPAPSVGPRSLVTSIAPSERVITTTRTPLGLTSTSLTSSTGPTISVVVVTGQPKRGVAHNIGCSNTAAPLFMLISTSFFFIHEKV